LTAAGHTRARAEFELLHSELLVVGIDNALGERAGELAEQHGLRGYDAVHLASALSLATDITFVSWDQDLRRAAAKNGCNTAPSD
jgi:predicted nucleic acid-binding protein